MSRKLEICQKTIQNNEEQKVMQGYRTDFITCVGSDMWGMGHDSSDIDLFRLRVADTHKILRGEKIHDTWKDIAYVNEQMQEIDEKAMEIGHLVNLLIKGNVNAIWAVCSPVVVLDSMILRKLRAITKANLSKASYHSINGLAYSQYKDHVKRADVMPPGKAIKSAIRTLQFGITMFQKGTVCFEPVIGTPTITDVEHQLTALKYARDDSSLPEEPNEDIFRDFLENERILGLK